MARQKEYDESLYWIRDAVAKYNETQASIRARYMALAEREARDSAVEMKRIIVEQFQKGYGASAIANSVGLSRSTVIRWKKEYEALYGASEVPVFASPEPTEPAIPAKVPAKIKARRTNFGRFVIDSHADYPQDERVFVSAYNSIGQKNHPDVSRHSYRPDWLTDDLLRSLEYHIIPGEKIEGAPWNN